jgi:geranylgeranyl diphosphate synthase type II
VNIADYIKHRASLVDAALEEYTTGDQLSIPKPLLASMRYSLLAGGKRLRPILVIAAAELAGAPPERVMPTALALEMIHTYSLVHDDLPCMDDDDVRRGQPTNHKVFGEAMATLAGDALLTMAFELLGVQATIAGVTAAQTMVVVREVAVAAGAAGMVGGQVEDMAWEGRLAPIEQLQRIHQLKTGALFRTALRSGAMLSGATGGLMAALDQFAHHFGLAFQIQDDVLDVIGDTAKMGKGTGRDTKHQKSTYVSLFGLAGAQERAQQEVTAAISALAGIGEAATPLRGLAQFVIDREG